MSAYREKEDSHKASTGFKPKVIYFYLFIIIILIKLL
jgi:hypothetical protein